MDTKEKEKVEIVKEWLDKFMSTDMDLQDTKIKHEGEEEPLFPFLAFECVLFYEEFNGKHKSLEDWLETYYFNTEFLKTHEKFANLYYHCD